MTNTLTLTRHKVQVIQTTGKNKGSVHYLIVRENVDGKLTVPRGYKLLAVIPTCEFCFGGFNDARPNMGVSSRDYHADCAQRHAQIYTLP